MYWNNDLKDYDPSLEYETVTHEIISEVHITGVVNYFEGNILIGPVATSPETGLYTYQIKTRHPKESHYDHKAATKKGYFHSEGIVGELTSLLSIFYQARFYIISTTHGELNTSRIAGRNIYKYHRTKVNPEIDSKVFGKAERSFEGFGNFLEKVATIDEAQHYAIVNACSHYNRALKEIGIDSEMVFIRLVSAIEALSKDFTLTKKDDPLQAKDLGVLFEQYSSDEREELNGIFDARKSMLKFIRFTEHYSIGFLRGGNYAAKHTKVTRAKLPGILKTIYVARSKYLHEGESMYLSQTLYGEKYDLDASVGMYIGMRQFTENQKLPNIHFFEGLVRHCVMRYIES
jgi:hypothetical protein